MKGNPILGTGSGSIGDVTIMRRNGSQVTRVRLRKIKNPMSQGQAEQRMYMAPILKFYSPLAGVLETSFEGLNKADSYAKFISVNANLARANEWAVKKGAGFTPLPYQVAGGSLPSIKLYEDDTQHVLAFNLPTLSREATTIGDLSTSLISDYGLQDGDQITIIQVVNGDEMTPNTKRFFIDTTSTENMQDFGLSELDAGSITVGSQETAAATIIVSRWDVNAQKWARSNAFMKCLADYLANYTGDEKLAAAIASYMKSAGKTPISDVYLNGSDE